jgi:hypothetical protein
LPACPLRQLAENPLNSDVAGKLPNTAGCAPRKQKNALRQIA